MTSKMKKIQTIIFLFSIGLLVLSAIQYSYIYASENVIHVRYEKNTVSAEQLDEYYEQYREEKTALKKKAGDVPEVTLWNQQERLNVTAGEYFSETDFSLIEGYGNLEKILPGRRLDGMYPPKGDTQGCAVSDAGAAALFGSSDVVGKTLTVNQKDYVIRGVIKEKRNMLWIQNPEAERFSYLELVYQGRTAASAAESWLSRQGLPVPDAVLAGGDYSAFNFLFLTLPVWAFIIYGYVMLKRQIGMVQIVYFRKVLLVLWGIGLTALIFAGIRCSFRFSLDYIPKRWSDFSFYQMKAEELIQAAGGISELKLLPGDAELIKHSRNSAYLAWASLILMGGARLLKAGPGCQQSADVCCGPERDTRKLAASGGGTLAERS